MSYLGISQAVYYISEARNVKILLSEASSLYEHIMWILDLLKFKFHSGMMPEHKIHARYCNRMNIAHFMTDGEIKFRLSVTPMYA